MQDCLECFVDRKNSVTDIDVYDNKIMSLNIFRRILNCLVNMVKIDN